jgi:hypothetical protein
MKRLAIIAAWVLLVVVAPARAAQAARAERSVLVVDPAHTDTGDAVAAWLSELPETKVRKVDVKQLRQSPAPTAGAVVWLAPEPNLYEGDARARWDSIVGNKAIGLMTIGLPHDDDGRAALMKALRRRVMVERGQPLARQFEGAKWIWAPETKDDQTVRLRRTIATREKPRRAWVEITADNRATVLVNGEKAGTCEGWRSPAAIDVTRLMRGAGDNAIEIEAWNQDGPGGVVAAVTVDGERTVTDETWQAGEAGDAPARVVAPFGAGPWGDLVGETFAAATFALDPAKDHPLTRGLDGPIGRCVLRCELVAGVGATVLMRAGDGVAAVAGEAAGGRAVVFAGEPELTTEAGDVPSVLRSPAFANFLRRSVLWLDRREIDNAVTDRPPAGTSAAEAAKPLIDLSASFPVTMQLSPIPHEGVPTPRGLPESPAALRRMIDDFADHGITLLQCPLPLPEHLAREVERHAQQRGMGITYYYEHGLGGFGREKPPATSLYSQAYRDAIARKLDGALKPLGNYERLANVFPMQDEPFHAGVESFAITPEDRAEFEKRFGYPMPQDLLALRDRDPKQWLDVVNFSSLNFVAGWKPIYQTLKQKFPNVDVVINHDSHNVFGGSPGHEAKIFSDDIYHWGGDYADVLSFDIYPYLMKDFRYGLNRNLRLPRMSQTHYALAHMRNVCSEYNRKLGFFFGTYHPEWFDLTPEGRKQVWQSREMIYTAVAGGCDYLIAGLNVPIDPTHWDDLGEGLRTLQKAAPILKGAKPPPARAAMLFPRAQSVQLQEEYWNVGQSFEAFQRAFGELDLLHEEQATADRLAKYKILVLFDVKLLPGNVIDAITRFVNDGGTVVADCVPTLDELKRPSDTMAKLFGVRDADQRRILWPVKMSPEVRSDPRGPASMPAGTQPSGVVSGLTFERSFDFPIVSGRPSTITEAEVLLKTRNREPALVRRTVGEGRAYLLGFCVQDTAFEAWRTRGRGIEQLDELLRAIAADAGATSRVRSSNIEVEAALRLGKQEAVLFVIAHEPRASRARISVRDLGFTIGRIVDIGTGKKLDFRQEGDTVAIDQDAPTGTTRLLHLLP